MCEHCVTLAEREFEKWPDAQQKTARLAIHGERDRQQYEKGVNEGMENEQRHRESQYKTKVAPCRAALLLAVKVAEDAVADRRETLHAILMRLIEQVSIDAKAIPEKLPS